jgi:hypothetical protein
MPECFSFDVPKPLTILERLRGLEEEVEQVNSWLNLTGGA